MLPEWAIPLWLQFATFPPDVPRVSFQDDVPNLKVKLCHSLCLSVHVLLRLALLGRCDIFVNVESHGA